MPKTEIARVALASNNIGKANLLVFWDGHLEYGLEIRNGQTVEVLPLQSGDAALLVQFRVK